jgi:anti-sigma factor RsiW
MEHTPLPGRGHRVRPEPRSSRVIGGPLLSCRDITELVTEHDEGELPLWRRLSFRLHLALCGHCRAYAAQLRATARALRALQPDPRSLAPVARDELMAAWRERGPSSLG